MFTGKVIVKLSKPFKWEDKDISVVELDFGKVTGGMINQCERDTLMSGNISGFNRPTSSEYCGRLASEISGVPFRAIEKMPFYDSEKIWQTVSRFVSHGNPKEFYDQFTAGDDDETPGFTGPAEKPETEKPETEKPEKKPATK